MLIDETKYKWQPWTQPIFTADDTWGQLTASSVHKIAGTDYSAYKALDGDVETQWESGESVLAGTLKWAFDHPLRIYRIELVNKASGSTMVTKTISAFADEEQTVEIASGEFGLYGRSELQLEPETPVATDCLVLALTTENKYFGLSDIRIIAEEGILKADLSTLYDTTEGMTCIRSSLNDDGTDTVAGMVGFFFNNVEAANVYVSGNHWLGFGISAEQLKVLRRDGICDHLYRGEGIVGADIPYLKLRWEGYTVYNNRSEATRLIFELFLLGNNDMVLNVVQTPTNTGYLGTSALICNNKTTNLDLADGSGTGKRVCFYHLDSGGLDWEIAYEEYEESDSYTARYLLKDGDAYYRLDTVKDEDLNDVQVLTPVEITDLTAAMFLKFGFEDTPPGKLLVPLTVPEIFYWSSNPQKIATPKVVMRAYPFPQTMSVAVDMSSISIMGIELLSAEYSGHIGVIASVDNGATYSEEMTIGAWLHTDVEELWASLPENRMLLLTFILYEDARFTRFKITFMN